MIYMKYERYIEQAYILAQDTPSFGNARICALLVVKNRIVSVGFNSSKSHPIALRYAKNPEAIYPHAEVNAIYNCVKRYGVINWNKATLYVARAKKQNKVFVPGLARPCESCEECIADFKIGNVVYTTGFGGYDFLY